MRAFVVIAALAGCYAPEPQSGSPCTDDTRCPSPFVCSPITMTCVVPGHEIVDAAVADTMEMSTCVPSAEICGDGIDQDCNGADPACVANDGPGGAIDITAGGTFSADSVLSRDDVEPNGCGSADGHDLFYKVTLANPEVYYFDTFGSSFDTVVRVFAKPCAQVGSGAGAAACADDACGGSQTQTAVALPAGESCVVVDGASATEAGALKLHVIRGRRDGKTLATGMRTTAGDTTNSTNVTDPIDMCDAPGSGGRDVAYFFTVCPNTSMLLDADLCPPPVWDPVLYVSRVTNTTTQLACRDDDCGQGPHLVNVPITNGELFVLYVDGFDPTHFGSFSLDTNIR